MKRATGSTTPLFFPLALLLSCMTVACGDSDTEEPATEAPENEAAPTAPAPTEGAPSETSAPAPSPEEAAGLALGGRAPMIDHAMKNVDEAQVTIESVAGDKGTLVIFTCNHCPWAIAWQERITALGNSSGEHGVGTIAINSNDPAEFATDDFPSTQARASELGMEFPYVMDETSNVARAYGASKTPEVFLFDAEWNLVYHGAVDDNSQEPDSVEEHYLRDALVALSSGSDIDPAETTSIGCSIKFRD